MNGREFLRISGVTIGVASAGSYLLRDKTNFLRSDFEDDSIVNFSFQQVKKRYYTWLPLRQADMTHNLVKVRLQKTVDTPKYDTQRIRKRRTVRSGYKTETLRKEDSAYLLSGENDFTHFIPNGSKEFKWLNEQTTELNRIQAYRNASQKELSEWIRFSSREAKNNCDGLITAGMELLAGTFEIFIIRKT